VRVFRIAKQRYARSASEVLSGDGAAEHGGRWNLKGVPAIYCCESLSLCALEILVHLPRGVLRLYSFIELDVPDEHVTHLSADTPTDDETAVNVGNNLLGQDGVLVFSVPSMVNSIERNVVINPVHPEFERITHGEVQPFPMDQRLVRR